MSSNIIANVSRMFAEIEPRYVSGSQAELGACAGSLTWRNALTVASNRAEWLLSDEAAACEGMRGWAKEAGAWDEEECASWSADECIALFVQNVASELRTCLGADEAEDLTECEKTYSGTDWDAESEYPIGVYYAEGNELHVDYYTGI